MKVSDTIGAGIGTDDAGQEEIDWFVFRRAMPAAPCVEQVA
jgi:hypothetical protein